MSNRHYTEDELLELEVMIRLYAQGAFPMADSETNSINWYLPEVRCVIPIDMYNIPRSLSKFYKTAPFEYRIDQDFITVVESCADRDPTWITPKLISAYLNLWNYGFIHTVEVYRDGSLVGGLYGVAIGGAFFGESMFSNETQASKCAMLRLLEILSKNKFTLLDVQYITDHLSMFGAREISMNKYKALLKKAYKSNPLFTA